MALLKNDEVRVERTPPQSPMFGLPHWLSGFEPFRGMFDEIRVEEFVEGDEVVVRAEIPGVDPDKDVTVTVDRGRLTIAAERREETTTREEGPFRSEFRYGSYSRTITLPPGADEQDVKATYTDGILTVRLQFTEPKSARTIPITKG